MKSGNLRAISIALVFAGCIHSDSVDCSFGVCPTGSTCDEVNHVCIPPSCGDGILQGAEQCDGAIDPAIDCTSFGYYSAAGLACTPSCTIDTSQCAGICGDHQVNGPEFCDGIPPAGESCANFGFEIGRVSCSADCGLGFSQCGTIGWQPGRGNAPDELHAVWGGSQTNMYSVGRGGAILHSNGVVWLPMTSPTTQHLNGVWGANGTNIFAVGDAGTIVHFDGTAWTTMTSGVTTDLFAISGTSTDVWAVGDGGTILHYPTAGGAWTAETSGTTVALRGVWAVAVVTPIAVGDATAAGTQSPTALQRVNGVWTPMIVPTIEPVLASSVVSLSAVWGSNLGFVAVGDATIASGTPHGTVLQVNTASGNLTWVYTLETLTPNDLKSVWGVVSTTSTDIFIGGLLGTLLHYTGSPGASHFRLYEANTTRGIAGLWGTGPAFVRGATLGGEVQEFDGTDVIATDLGIAGKNLVGVYEDAASGIAIAVGDSGYVARHDYTGWMPATQVGTANMNAIWGAGATVFVATANGILMSTNDGLTFGAPALTGTTFAGLWGQAATDVYAVGNGGAVAHYNGTWSPFATVGTSRWNGIWGDSSSDIFIVGNAGTIAHYNGSSWTRRGRGVPYNVVGVWGTSGTDVFVAGGAGTILHYDGTAWKRMTSNSGQDFETVGGTSHDDIYVGGRGTLLHYQGDAWAPMGLPIDDIYGMWVQNSDSYFVGNIATLDTTDGSAMTFTRTILPTEERCQDPWDNDGDGLSNCFDSDCVADAACVEGGPCQPATAIACGDTTPVGTSTYTGVAHLDDLPCLDHATPGPEASYRLVAPADGMITVTLADPTGLLDLVQLDPLTATPACDVSHCTAATANMDQTQSISFMATANATYYFLVDGPSNTAEPFTLSATCN